LGLAIALINEPAVLLLDEPTTGVDPLTRQDFWRLIIPLLARGNIAVLVSTPYMDEAARCTRVGFMRGGRIIREGPPGELRNSLKGRVIELMGEPRVRLAALAAADRGVEAVQRFGRQLHLRVAEGQAEPVISRLLAAANAEAIQVEWLRPAEPQLEDVFIALAEAEPSAAGESSSAGGLSHHFAEG
jgi:ABC-2 type transport system ATP-binding protein